MRNGSPLRSTATIGVEAIAEGVAVEFTFTDADGRQIDHYRTHLDRATARAFARQVSAAAGDAIERTFPQPQEASDGR